MKDNRCNTINNPQLIANKFNEFFTNIGPSLATKIPHSTVEHKSYLRGSFNDSFFASPTDEIINIVSSLKSSNSEGVDGIKVNVIKASIDLLASPLSQMCNTSFSTGIVPDKFKIIKILSIFKSEVSTNFTNYRPISILPCFSKILEGALYRRLMDYLTKHSILNNHQYGFRKKHSTFIAILELTNKIFDSFEKNECAIGIFIDLKKAFDTVNHSILLDKLNFYGIRGTFFNWTYSCLLSRSQYVQIDSWKSPLLPLKCNPQGSVLGPLLFLIYINDIFYALIIPHSSFLQTTLIFSFNTKISLN